jgi:hypothetical protein
LLARQCPVNRYKVERRAIIGRLKHVLLRRQTDAEVAAFELAPARPGRRLLRRFARVMVIAAFVNRRDRPFRERRMAACAVRHAMSVATDDGMKQQRDGGQAG